MLAGVAGFGKAISTFTQPHRDNVKAWGGSSDCEAQGELTIIAEGASSTAQDAGAGGSRDGAVRNFSSATSEANDSNLQKQASIVVEAAYAGDVSTVTEALEMHVDPNMIAILADESVYSSVGIGPEPLTALQAAAAVGAVGVVEKLLLFHADVHIKGTSGMSALHFAALAGSVDTVGLLLDKGADPCLMDATMQSPLHFAVAGSSAKLGIGTSCADLVARLCSTRQDDTDLVNLQNRQGYTALALLASIPDGQVTVAQELIDHGAAVNILESKHRTAAHLAAQAGNLPVFICLLESGASLFQEDKNNVDVLQVALSEVSLATELLRRPSLLGSLPLLLSLVQALRKMADQAPAYGPDYRQLAKTCGDTAVSLVESCSAMKAHYLLQAPPAKEVSAWCDDTALNTALAVNCKQFVAHRTFQQEMVDLWMGNCWSSEKEQYEASGGVVAWHAPRTMFYVNLITYCVYLALFAAVSTESRASDAPILATEVLIYVYILGFLFKEMAAAYRLRRVYFRDTWNWVDTIIGVGHLAIFCVRAGKLPGVELLIDGTTSIVALASWSRLLLYFNISRTL
ncbi:hypothetical protein CYMTET_18137, partial [Cymbomonas tetramitiformis]